MSSTDRRSFLKTAGWAALGFAGLRQLVAARELGATAEISPLGPLFPDGKGIFKLPSGFEHRIISTAGEVMDDGLHVPGKHDGMAAFPGPGGRTILVCNHENAAHWRQLGAFGEDLGLLGQVPADRFYDFGHGRQPCLGGTTTLVYDTRRQARESIFLSLAGTERNCAGGPTPWGSWITCEETTQAADRDFAQSHGYNFEVPATATPELAAPVPLKAMGRFRHEAIAVHEPSGVVFQTEDLGDGLIYRFLPHEPGRLAAGGRLQALALRGRRGADTRNWSSRGWSMPVGRRYPVTWLDLYEVEAPRDDLRHRGRRAGAATFARGEGMWADREEVFWCCTNGGPNMLGQVFRYTASPFEGTPREADAPGEVELFVQSSDATVLQNCDNCTVAPWGDLIIAEDTDAPCRLIGVTPDGACYPLALNTLNGSELAGPCFSPDGSTLFVNIQNPGLTLAITGPWPRRKERAA